jgi:hypothetical protein
MEKQMLMPFFGMLYAQCEDDLRIEMNYIEKLGRLSEKGNPFYIMIWKQD